MTTKPIAIISTLIFLLAACVPIDLPAPDESAAAIESAAASASDDESAAASASDDESVADDVTEDESALEGVVALEFHTYDADWVRYRNLDPDGAARLAHSDVTRYPFRHVQHPTAVGLADLEAPGALAALIEHHGLASPLPASETAAESTLGSCDTQRLAGLSTDLFCEPGAAAMPAGHVLLALYHPHSNTLVAVTTTIANPRRAAAAAPAKTQPAAAARPAADTQAADTQAATTDSGLAKGQQMAPAQDETTGCGPFAAGAWITPAAYAEAGVGLAVNMEGVHGRPVRVYECVVPAEGAAYLQAYGDFSNDGGGETGGGGSTSSGGGGVVPDPGCTHPLGCDQGNSHQ